jgi:hypothetical protein
VLLGYELFGGKPGEELGAVSGEDFPADLVIDELTFSLCHDQAGAHEFLDVVRNRCLGDREVTTELTTWVMLVPGDGLQKGEPPGSAKALAIRSN